jgi:hypothetical protein
MQAFSTLFGKKLYFTGIKWYTNSVRVFIYNRRRAISMNEITQLISGVGFPIAACIGMGWFFKYFYDKSCDTTAKLSDAVNNNTQAMLKLLEKIDGGGDKK